MPRAGSSLQFGQVGEGAGRMDGYARLDDDGGGGEPAIERPPAIGADERRMHVRAYNHWVSLLAGRDYPSIKDLDVANPGDFGPDGVLLDFTAGAANPRTPFIGHRLAEECGLTGPITEIAQVPKRSLLSRLTDHYLQIIANRAPIGFEAEFVSQRGRATMYRGILMPLSSDGDRIDFIYGVINWKELADPATSAALTAQVAGQMNRRLAEPPAPPHSPVWADGPSAEHRRAPAPEPLDIGHFDAVPDADEPLLLSELPADAGLADRLCIARETAEAVKSADSRSRAALYRALGQAYDFALAARDAPEDYLEILADAGLRAQARAPMTPIAKLIFGIDYDKTRLTEFAAALGHGIAQGVAAGEFTRFLERAPGGLKGIVAAARAARRPAARPAPADSREALRQTPALAHVDGLPGTDEFVLLVARREANGALAVVAEIAGDEALLDRAIRRAGAAA